MSLTSRIVLGSTLVAMLTIMVLIGGAERVLRGSLESRLRADLEREAGVVASLLPTDPSEQRTALATLQSRSGHRLVIRSGNGTVVAVGDSITSPDALRMSRTVGTDTVVVTSSADDIDLVMKLTRRSMVRAALLALLVVIVSAWLTGRTITRPLRQLTQAARMMSSGTTLRLPASGVPEIESLAQALRQLHRRLSDHSSDLQRERTGGVELIEAMADGVLAVDEHGQLLVANSAAHKMLGYSLDEAMPGLMALFRDPRARAACATVLEDRKPAEIEIIRDDRSLALHARPVSNGGAVLVLTDLTELRRLEAIRRDFVANVSHELKTPLTSIRASAETLSEPDLTEEDRTRFLAMVEANARRMQSLIEDLLDLSRIESGNWELHLEQLDLDTLIREAWRPHAERAVTSGVTLSVDVDPSVGQLVADPQAVRQVFGNLFDNAIRHVGPGGRITVSGRAEGDGVVTSVIDDGSGIALEHQSRIFERFYRIDSSRSRDQGGTGLGLAIVRHLVESHGGTVGVTSVPRQGTTIRCWWPKRELG